MKGSRRRDNVKAWKRVGKDNFKIMKQFVHNFTTLSSSLVFVSVRNLNFSHGDLTEYVTRADSNLNFKHLIYVKNRLIIRL